MNKLYIILASLAFISACKKDKTWGEEEVKSDIINYDIRLSKWVLYDAIVLVDNLDTQEKIYYNHFGSNKSTSNLNILEGSGLPIDNVIQNNTTWFFDVSFTLNDSLEYEYSDFNSDHGNYQIFGLENGSSRPIEIIKKLENTFSCRIHEAWQSDLEYNYHYVNVLTFIKEGTDCIDCLPRIEKGYTEGGTLFNPYVQSDTDSIIGTKWVITRYDEGTTPFYPDDTLHFVSEKHYTTNGGAVRDYTIYSINGTNLKNLTLYYSMTLGGSFSGKVNETFIEDGEINNAPFTDLFDENRQVTVWFTKIN